MANVNKEIWQIEGIVFFIYRKVQNRKDTKITGRGGRRKCGTIKGNRRWENFRMLSGSTNEKEFNFLGFAISRLPWVAHIQHQGSTGYADERVDKFRTKSEAEIEI